jgi:ribosomal protein S18 acetylase RimI-like enzyme
LSEGGSPVLRLSSEPDSRDVARELDDRINAHNVAVTGIPFGGAVTICLRDGGGNLRGGAHGWVWAGWFYVDSLWVDPDLRGHGWGHRLLRDAETEAERLGARRAYLETHSFQARPFYEAHGYRVVGELPDYPPGGAYYLMAKALVEPPDSEAALGGPEKGHGYTRRP